MTKKRPAFTLVELLVTIAIFSVISTLVGINLLQPQLKATVDSQFKTLIADTKSQQLKAMLGASEGQATSQRHGIHFENTSYTLFFGNSYVPAAPENFVINLETGTKITTTLPTPDLIFEKLSGEVVSFSLTQNTISIVNSDGQTKTLTVNKLGSFLTN